MQRNRGLIMLNAVVIGLETDFRQEDKKLGDAASIPWVLASSMFTFIFLGEANRLNKYSTLASNCPRF